MNVEEIINNDIMDLKVGMELAENINNDIVKDYAINRIERLNNNIEIYKTVSINNVVDSYVVDLALFINISHIVNDRESKDYFKGKLSTIMKSFPYLKEKRKLVNLI